MKVKNSFLKIPSHIWLHTKTQSRNLSIHYYLLENVKICQQRKPPKKEKKH
jgi:hypothetical protein